MYYGVNRSTVDNEQCGDYYNWSGILLTISMAKVTVAEQQLETEFTDVLAQLIKDCCKGLDSILERVNFFTYSMDFMIIAPMTRQTLNRLQKTDGRT